MGFSIDLTHKSLMDKEKEEQTPASTGVVAPMRNVPQLFSESRNGATYIPRSSRWSTATVQVLPELTGHRWGDASLALVTGLRPKEIRVVGSEVCLDSVPGRVTVHTVEDHGLDIITSIDMEVSIELVAGHLQNGYDTRRKLQEYCEHCGMPIEATLLPKGVVWTHSATGMKSCRALRFGDDESLEFAAPKKKVTPVYRASDARGEKHTMVLPKPKAQVTEAQLRAALEDIQAATKAHSFALEKLDWKLELPGTQLHTFLFGYLRQLYELKLEALPAGALGYKSHSVLLCKKHCLEQAIESAVKLLMEAQDQGLILHWMIRE